MPDSVMRILAVDDVPKNLDALAAGLDQPGVELVRAASGEEALELLLGTDFALALLDVQLPGIDGFELAELMRGTERTRSVPIIFLTAVATDEMRRFRGFEAGAVDYMLKPLDMHALNRKVAVFVELARQRAELARQRDELGLALGRLRAHGDNSPLGLIELDTDLRILGWARGAERIFGFEAAQLLGTRLTDAPFFADIDRAGFVAGMQHMLAGEHSEMQRHAFRTAAGALREGEWYCSSLAPAGGRAMSVMLQVLDVTERVRAEETQRLLVGELNHRVKNSLATVQAIASQSFRHAVDSEGFRKAFTGRIKALASAHSLLSATTWESAGLRKLVADQLGIGSIPPERLVIAGDDLELPPEQALRFALVLHELTTNAQKYGAWSLEGGRVELSWRVDAELLRLEWQETGGPTVAEPERQGFGNTLIEGSLAGEGGSAEVEYRAAGIVWRLALPVSEAGRRQLSEAAAPAASAASAQAATGAGLKVLVIEDEPLVGLELVMGLEDAGHQPIGPVSTCDRALEAIAREEADFALLDGNLHGEPVDRVAARLAERAIPFAFVSGYGSANLPEGFRDRPIVAKPFTTRDVLRAIESATSLSHA